MHYKTLRTTLTGQKLQILEDKISNAFALQKYLAIKLGAEQYQQDPTVYCGGFYRLYYAEGVKAPRYMKAQKGGGFMPDMDSIEGQTIQEQIDKLPIIYKREVNSAVVFNGKSLFSIAVHFTNTEVYLFSINSDALKNKIVSYSPPTDVVCINESEYKSLKNS